MYRLARLYCNLLVCWSYRACIEDRSAQFTDPPTLCLSLSLFPSSQRTLVGFCPVLPASVAKRNHCLVLLRLGKSMGVFVSSASCRTWSPILTCHDCSLLSIDTADHICEPSVLLERLQNDQQLSPCSYPYKEEQGTMISQSCHTQSPLRLHILLFFSLNLCECTVCVTAPLCASVLIHM